MTVATISVSLFRGTELDTGKSVITVPLGARSGTLSQAEAKAMNPRSATAAPEMPNRDMRIVLDAISDAKDNTLMDLQGQGSQRGYAMATLLVSIAVMSVLMSVAMPAYRHLARREKEAELAFRGEQYARAIAMYRAKNGNTFPPSIDVLVQEKYLRKKYRDPMTSDGEFRIMPVGNPTASQPGGRGAAPPQGRGTGQGGSFVGGGIMGVASKSTETSIRIYKGQTRYDMWPFTFNVVNRPGGNMPGVGVPGGPGGQPRPGGRGRGERGIGPGRGGRGLGPGPGDRGGRGFGGDAFTPPPPPPPRSMPGRGGPGL